MTNVPASEALSAMLAAAQLGSFSAAADELGVTHGAISRRIGGLEAWLGEKVFERHGRGVVLTPIGEQFARRVEQSLDAIATVAADIRTGSQRNFVRLSVLPSVARLWVMPRLVTLHGTPPDLIIGLTAEHRMAPLDAREADLAIRAGGGNWSGVRSDLLFEERELYPVASPKMAQRLEGATPAELMNATLLHNGDAGDWKRWFRGAGVNSYRPKGGERRFDDYDLTLEAAAVGLGVALGRDPLSSEAVESGRVVRLDGPTVPGRRGHYLVSRLGENRQAVLKLAQRIRALAEENPGRI